MKIRKLEANLLKVLLICGASFSILHMGSKNTSQKDISKDNCEEAVVYWSTEDLLYVKIGDLEVRDIKPEEAYERFKDNNQFCKSYFELMEDRNSGLSREVTLPQDNFELERVTSLIFAENYEQEANFAATNVDPEDLFSIISSENSGQKRTKKNINIEEAKQEIEEKIEEIILELNLQESDDIITQLKNCCLVQKYIVEHNTYDGNIMNEKAEHNGEELAILDLYNAVVLQRGVCTSNASMFKKILERVGVKVEIIILLSSEGTMHASNIVELDGKYYFFDSTLETTIYEQNKDKSNGKVVLCCAALGKNEYYQFYSPQVVLPDDLLKDAKEVPKNIAEQGLPYELVNDLILPISASEGKELL